MEHIKLAHDNPVLADLGFTRVDLSLWFPLEADDPIRHVSHIDVDSGIQPVSSRPSGYFPANYLADSSRSQMASQMDGHRTCMSRHANLSYEEGWPDGAARRATCRNCRRSEGQFFYRPKWVVSRPEILGYVRS